MTLAQEASIAPSPTADSAIHRPKHVVILCHPDPNSFNAAVAQTYCDAVGHFGHAAIIRDLYQMGFDPVLKAWEEPSAEAYVASDDVAAELALLHDADVVVFVYPIWFGTPPAMLKGYVERVLGAGFGHRLMRERSGHSIVEGKHLLSISTSGNSIQWLNEQGAWVALRTVFDSYIANAFSMASTERLHLPSIVKNMKEHDVRSELYKVTDAATKVCARLLAIEQASAAAQ